VRIEVDRRTWLRGETGSRLLREGDGKMCCFGFACLQYGLSKDDIMNKGNTAYLDVPFRASPVYGVDDRNWVWDAMRTNDNVNLTGFEREHILTNLFADNGHELIFTN